METSLLYSTPVAGREYCDERVGLGYVSLFFRVSVREYIFENTQPICINFLCQLPGGAATSYLSTAGLWLTLFAHNGQNYMGRGEKIVYKM